MSNISKFTGSFYFLTKNLALPSSYELYDSITIQNIPRCIVKQNESTRDETYARFVMDFDIINNKEYNAEVKAFIFNDYTIIGKINWSNENFRGDIKGQLYLGQDSFFIKGDWLYKEIDRIPWTFIAEFKKVDIFPDESV